MGMRSIQELVDGLSRIAAASFTHQRVLQEIGRTVIDPQSLHPYLFFCPTHYTRNLIHYCELFEVVGVGWEPGQQSPVHNHRGQECWMGVPIGRLQVQNYRLLAYDPVEKTCRLEPSIRFEMNPEHPAAVDPAEPIHSVHNLPEHGGRAVSVHVYSRPFHSCEVYLPEQGRCFEVPLDYTSKFGVLCPGEIAQAATV